MKRILLLMFAATGLAFVITMAQTRDKKARVSGQEIVTDRPAPEPPTPPTPPELTAPEPPAAPPTTIAPPKAPKAPKVMIKIKGC